MELSPTAIPKTPGSSSIPVLERMMDAVHRYEGTVNQVMGDGIMALFGAPWPMRTTRCGPAMRPWPCRRPWAICRGGPRARRAWTLQMRVGLNAGEVVVRAIGNDLHMDYSAVGQTTHLAARMEQIARPGTSALLTADTLRLVEG